MRSIITIIIIAFSLNLFGQQEGYIYLAKALKNPSQATHIWLEPSKESIEHLSRNIQLFTQVQAIKVSGLGAVEDIDRIFLSLDNIPIVSLELENNSLTGIPENIALLTNLECLKITGNSQINYSILLKHLSETSKLRKLSLIENDLKKLPNEIITIDGLHSLSIEGNDQLNFKKAVKVLSKLPDLRQLKLPINQMSGLPPNIGSLNQLELLDLRNNIITELEGDMRNMDSLNNLRIEGNIIVDPVEELGKVKDLNIKYLSLDKGLSSEDKKQLKVYFPNAAIEETGFEEIKIDSTRGLKQGNEVNVIKVRKEKTVRVLSDAYLHYAEIFNQSKYGINMDNKLFEERYSDLGYVGIWARQPNTSYRNIKLSYFPKSKKNEIWFDFNRSTKGKECFGCYIYKNNPEINAFIGMKWVYVGAIDKKEFKDSYIKSRYYDDFRVFYDHEKLNFTIELKHEDGFDKLVAYPRYSNRKVPLDQSQRTYQKRYERYLSNLDRRKKRFNRMMGNQRRNLDKIEEMRKDEWGVFSKTYMSEQERKMTKDEWMDYYHKVVAQEQSALFNSKANTTNLIRSLEISGYALNQNKRKQAVPVIFNDSKSNRFAPFKLIVVNHNTKILQLYNAPLSRDPISVDLSEHNNYSIILEDVNGDTGVFNKGINHVDHTSDKKVAVPFEMKRFKSKLTTVADVREYLSK